MDEGRTQSQSAAPATASATVADHGTLPAWQSGELPAPLPFSLRNVFRTIGPGAILLAGSIGGGEWIVGPMAVVKYGPGILWICTTGVLLQMIFNMEAVRYTLYTGEPILTGFMRLNPGSRFWAIVYIAGGTAQLATPALALGCANVLFAAAHDRLPDPGGADGRTLLWISYGVLAAAVILLLSGKSIERVLERLSWGMIAFILVFLLVANVMFVPLDNWLTNAAGFVTPQALPENIDWLLLGVFAATSGSGGIGNMAISNWCRDKGFGMGAHMGSIGGVLAQEHSELAPIGRTFPVTDENLRRWKDWWKYVRIDQFALWALGCVVGMFLNVNLATAIVPTGVQLTGEAAGAFQAKYMAEQAWSGFWVLALLNGFWILFSTQLGNSDCLTRVVADACWSGWPRLQRWSSSRLYATLLMLFTTWGVVALALGTNALSLFKVLGILASPILSIGALQILRVNTRFLPAELRPRLWRRIGLVLCALAYGAIAVTSLVSLVTGD